MVKSDKSTGDEMFTPKNLLCPKKLFYKGDPGVDEQSEHLKPNVTVAVIKHWTALEWAVPWVDLPSKHQHC
jgi:hypothetical protein